MDIFLVDLAKLNIFIRLSTRSNNYDWNAFWSARESGTINNYEYEKVDFGRNGFVCDFSDGMHEDL